MASLSEIVGTIEISRSVFFSSSSVLSLNGMGFWSEEFRLITANAIPLGVGGDDDVIGQGNADGMSGLGQSSGGVAVGGGWRGVTAGMVMDNHHRCRARAKRSAADGAWTGVGSIDIAAGHFDRTADESQTNIERQTPQAFVVDENQRQHHGHDILGTPAERTDRHLHGQQATVQGECEREATRSGIGDAECPLEFDLAHADKSAWACIGRGDLFDPATADAGEQFGVGTRFDRRP